MRHRTPLPDVLRIRHAIDDVDDCILALVAHGAELAVQAGSVKDREGIRPYDGEREAAVVCRLSGLARARGLDAELVREVYWRIIEISRTVQGAATTGAAR